MKKGVFFFSVLRLPVDFAMLLASGITAYFFRTTALAAFRPVLFEFNLPLSRYFTLTLFVSLLFVGAYAVSGLYSLRGRLTVREEMTKVLIASSAGIMVVIVYIFLRQELFDSRFLVLGSWFLALVFVFAGRILVRVLQRLAVGYYDFGVLRVAVIGNDEVSRTIAETFLRSPASGYRLAEHIHEFQISDAPRLLSLGVDEVILANPDVPAETIVHLVDFCHEHHMTFKFVPNIYRTLTTNYDVDSIGNIPVVELKRTSLDGWGRVAKRVLDIVVSALALVILSPLFAVCAFAVKWETAGPVFVRLRRVSRNRVFHLYKFRSMVENAEELKQYLLPLNERSDGPLFKIKNDPRITGVGRFLRKYRIDELPQFYNILKGDISLVGPRPHQPDEIARYEKRHKKVLAIKGGATGFAQVSGSSDLPFEEEVRLDTFYVENWSLWLDFKIVILTALKMFRDRSAV